MLGARTRLWNQAVRASDLYLPGNGSFAPLLFLGEDVSGIRTEKEHLHICFAYFDHVSFLELVRFWVRFFPCYCSIFESDIFNLHITCCIWELTKDLQLCTVLAASWKQNLSFAWQQFAQYFLQMFNLEYLVCIIVLVFSASWKYYLSFAWYFRTLKLKSFSCKIVLAFLSLAGTCSVAGTCISLG